MNLYSDGTCYSNGCDYIYWTDQCRSAGIALGVVLEDSPRLAVQRIAVFPKGCYWLSNAQVEPDRCSHLLATPTKTSTV